MKLATHEVARIPLPASLAVLLALAACRSQAASASSTSAASTHSDPLPAQSDAEAGKGSAQLWVRVLARENDVPLEHPGLRLTRDEPDSDDDADLDEWEERPGWHHISVPSQTALHLEVGGAECQRESFAIPALTERELRKVDVRVTTADDLVVFGRLVDAESGAAITNGTVRVEEFGTSDPAQVAAKLAPATDGEFEMHSASWRSDIARAEAPGFACARFALSASHATREQALIVELSRCASLDVMVHDRMNAAVGGARVSVQTDTAWLVQREGTSLDFVSEQSEDMVWSASTDAAGGCALEAVAPNVPLVVELEVDGVLSKRELQPLVLAPSERRTLELVADPGAVVTGIVVDQDGHPVKECPLALFHADNEARKYFEFGERPTASTKSGADGRFRIESVPCGLWWLGPANSDADGFWMEHGVVTGTLTVHPEDQPATPDVAPIGVPVRIDPGAASVDTIVHADHGLHIRGVVRGPDGEPSPNATIHLKCNYPLDLGDELTEDDGTFDIGPLSAGQWILTANGKDDGFGESRPLEVAAGTSDVVFDLPAACAIRGRVGGEPVSARRHCLVLLARQGHGVEAHMTGEFGLFEFRGIEFGDYEVFAFAEDGRVAFRNVRANAESSPPDWSPASTITLEPQPGARLRVRCAGKAGMCSCRVSFAGTELYADVACATHRFAVPAGDIVVELTNIDTGASARRSVHLSAGEEREVVFDAP